MYIAGRYFNKYKTIVAISRVFLFHRLVCTLGVKVRNMKMDLNIYGTCTLYVLREIIAKMLQNSSFYLLFWTMPTCKALILGPKRTVYI